MKFRWSKIPAVLILAGATLWQGGCSSSSINQVVDTVSPSTITVIAGTTQVFISTVTGATDINSSWACTYVYTPAPTSSQPNPSPTSPANCTSGMTVNGGSIGTWTTDQTTVNNTLSYSAPTLQNFPNPIPVITFTAAAEADKKKTGTATVSLDTGIRISVTPLTATAPVGLNPAQQIQFTATLANSAPLGLNWQVMQPVIGSNSCTSFPSLASGGACGTATPLGATCSPNCGSIDTSTGVFTAPASMPTDTFPISSGSSAATAATTVTVVVWKTGDIFHYATATITLVNSSTNPITFTGIHPTTIAAGGILQDIWLDAKNILNTTPISFTPPGGSQTPQTINPSNIFTVPITAAYCTPTASGVTPVVTCDASIMTRIRLTASQIANAGVAQVTVSNIPDPNNPGQTKSVSFPLNIVYASPAIVGAVPDSYPQGTATQFSTDGGYYGGGSSPIVNLLFNGSLNVASAFGPRQFTGPLQGSQVQSPGLYPISIVSNAPQSGQPPFNPPPYPVVTTDVAVQPTFAGLSSTYFSSATPPVQVTTPPSPPLPPAGAITNLAPSSIALNSTKGYAVITEQASNTIQIVQLAVNSSTGRAVPQFQGGPIAVGNQPTSVAIDDQLDLTGAGYPGQDLGVVVNSGDSTLTLVALPSGNIIGSPISLSGLIQEPPGTSAPLPFAVGIDPGTHYAVVAFSNATLGFIVYVNPNPVPSGVTPPPCFVSTQTAPCAIASVSLNTGPTPQVVMQPNAPLAYVTPGGSGVTSVVNLLLTNNSVAIAAAPNGAVRTNNIVTITTANPNGLNQSSPGAVLIAGVSPADFNGTYNVTSALTYTFTYSQAGNNETGGGGTVTFGNPYYTFSTSATVVGGAINPITRTFAFADPNSSTVAPQIGFIRTLDQTVSSLFLTVGSCITCSPSPAGAPETGVRSVAWDPFTNVLIAFNPQDNFNQISLINPGGPTATGTQNPYRIIQAINTGQHGLGSYTPGGSSTPTTVYGPMAYDPKTNLVLVANAGSNTLTYLDLDPSSTFKKVHIRDIQVVTGGVASSQPPLASAPGAPNPLPVAVCDPTNPTNPYAACLHRGVTAGGAATLRILGQGFLSGGTPTVRLDGDPTGITISSSSDSEIDVSVPASRLMTPHDFALDVVSGSVNSNTNELHVVGIINLKQALSSTCTTAIMPEAVAYDDIRNVAVVTNYGCNSISLINMDSTNSHNYGVPYGSVMSSVSVGKNPLGVAVIPRLGYAVVANNGENTASIVDISSPLSPKALSFPSCTTSTIATSSTNICVGIAPSGVAIDQDRALALVANSGANSVSAIDLTPLLQATTADCASPPSAGISYCTPPMQLVPTSGPPTAIAIDSNRQVAVVTNIQNTGTTSATGGLDVVSLSSTPPTKSSTASISTLTANPTSIVFDPAPSAATPPSAALFYTASTQQNALYSFDPDSSSTTLIRVGINPYSVAYNYQTGTILTINSTSNTSSIIDAVNAPVFSTRDTLGIGSQSQFAAAVDNFTNTAIVADQNNDRVLIIALPQ
ncbi:MAG TPA: hypothetical protein VED66_14475 [Candidatus Sulfotelmatobacter sp.]|nr:hypothetical protein [Candidatus Sulfotelmatobacter sp.]